MEKYFLKAANNIWQGYIPAKPYLGTDSYFSLAQFAESQISEALKIRNDESVASIQDHKKTELAEVNKQLRQNMSNPHREKELKNHKHRLELIVKSDTAERECCRSRWSQKKNVQEQ